MSTEVTWLHHFVENWSQPGHLFFRFFQLKHLWERCFAANWNFFLAFETQKARKNKWPGCDQFSTKWEPRMHQQPQQHRLAPCNSTPTNRSNNQITSVLIGNSARSPNQHQLHQQPDSGILISSAVQFNTDRSNKITSILIGSATQQLNTNQPQQQQDNTHLNRHQHAPKNSTPTAPTPR